MSLTEVFSRPRARPRPAKRRDTELNFLRLVPGNSPVHRLWAGTKLLVAFELALMVSISPTWQMLAATAGVVAVELLVARIPLGAFPRLPSWFYGLLGLSAVLSLWSSIEPMVHIGGVGLSIGALDEWARFTSLAIVLVISGALVGWTTPLGEVAPALERLGRPLRWLRLPVDEWVIAIALAIRCLPLLIEEIRVLAAARRLRAHDVDGEHDHPRAVVRRALIETNDLLATAIVASIRRARDLADAIVARGGIGTGGNLPGARFRAVDGIVLLATTALCVTSLTVLHL
ncbi:MAG TPA: energy-coupling factor transporter transmembrane protein EcfT [Acidimicrobiia bacterium]|nr:energy-coupling factor transporter transmembrane protein EcfT [Acidimicrobiia bacterium]